MLADEQACGRRRPKRGEDNAEREGKKQAANNGRREQLVLPEAGRVPLGAMLHQSFGQLVLQKEWRPEAWRPRLRLLGGGQMFQEQDN